MKLSTHLTLNTSLALLLLAPVDLYGDTIVLTNGDKFTGEVKSLDSGKLTVKLTYVDDPIVIDASMLASVKTDKEMKASLQDGSTVSGKLAPAAAPGSFLAASSATPVEFKNVATIALVVPDPETPKTWKDRIATDTGLSYSFTGNSGYQTLTWHTTTEYYGSKWEPLIDLQQNLSGTSQIKSNRQSYGYITVNYYLTDHLFLYPLVIGLKQTMVDVGYGSSIQSGGGIGWAFRREKQYRLLLQGGPAAETGTAVLFGSNMPGQSGDLRIRRTIPLGTAGLNWNVRPDEGLQWTTQLLYSHSFDSDVKNRNRLAVNFVLHVPIKGPLSLDFQARDFANILRPGLLSLKTFNLSTGFSISY